MLQTALGGSGQILVSLGVHLGSLKQNGGGHWEVIEGLQTSLVDSRGYSMA